MLEGLEEFDRARTPAKARFEVEALITECMATLNRQPVVRSFLEALTKKKNAAIPYTPGQEDKLKALLGIVYKGLTQDAQNAEKREQETKTQRKALLKKRGLDSLKAGDMAKGKAALRVLAEEFGSEPGLFVQVAEWLIQYKLYFEAAELLEQAIETFPKETKAYALAVSCYRSIRELEKAESVYLRALQRFGTHPRTLLNLAKLYVEWNKRDKAFQAANDAWKKDNSLTEAKEIADKFA